MRSVLILALSLLGTCWALGGRSANSALALVAARSSEAHPLHATDPITIWCAPDNPQVVLKSAHFVRVADGQKFEATLSPTKKNATYTFGSPSVKDAGEYKCEMDTPHGKISHKAFIYSRPVVHSNEHFTEHEGHEYHLESAGTTVEQGATFSLTCPVTGYPKPVVKWAKDGSPLALSKSVSMEGSTVVVAGANKTDGGVYSCEAVNEYTLNGKTSKMLLVVDRMVDVRSEYTWVWPLLVIVVTVLILVLIIVICEWRNKKAASKN